MTFYAEYDLNCRCRDETGEPFCMIECQCECHDQREEESE